MSFPINTQIPNAPNDPADDQPEMKKNFVNINSFLKVDHVDPGAANNGYHKQIHMSNQSAPGVGTATGVLYANAAGGNSWPFWQNALGSVSLLTGKPTLGTNGVVYLPGGIILQWGLTALVGAPATITFTPPFPGACLNVGGSLAYTGTIPSNFENFFIDTASLSTTQFQGRLVGSGITNPKLYWYAIGF